MTPARRRLEALQQHPLRGPDRAKQLYDVLATYLPGTLRQLVAAGTVVVGSVRTDEPYAQTEGVPPDGHLVTVSTGMMDFVYAVSRAMAAVTNVIQAGAAQTASMHIDEAAPRIATMYRTWKRHFLLPWRLLPFGRPRLDRFDFPITREAHELAEMFATRAEAFILAHELGHVLIDRGLTDVQGANEEARADEAGFRIFLSSEHSRVGVASAMRVVRLLAGLTRAGFRFSDVYPPPVERIDRLFHVLRDLSGTDRAADEFATIAIANSLMLDAAENLAFGPRHSLRTDERHVRITLVAVLEEFVRHRMDRAALLRDFAGTARVVDAATRRRLFAVLVRYYLVEVFTVDGHLPRDVALQMGGTLIELARELPPDVGGDLQAALSSTPGSGDDHTPR